MQKHSILTLTVIAAGVIAAERFVTAAGAYPTAAGPALGVSTTSAAAAGDAFPVDVLGTTVVTAGEAFAKGDAIAVGTSGKAVYGYDDGYIVGHALQASTGDGDRVEILLIPTALPGAR
ncbi:MAG TPA: capsid cement protein [Xanthomonadaceae bacterium]